MPFLFQVSKLPSGVYYQSLSLQRSGKRQILYFEARLLISFLQAKRRNVDDLKALDAQLLRLKHAIIEPLIGTRSEDLSDALRKRIEELCRQVNFV